MYISGGLQFYIIIFICYPYFNGVYFINFIFILIIPLFFMSVRQFLTNSKVINLEAYNKKRGACIDTPFFIGPETLMKPEFPVTFKTRASMHSN